MEKIFAPETSRELIRGWLIHARKSWKKHDMAARRLEWHYRGIGIASIIFSAVVGGSLFSSLAKEQGVWIRLIFGGVSVSASVLASLLAFQRYEQRTERHRAACADYKGALQTLERLHAELHENRHLDPLALPRIGDQFHGLEKMAPVVPEGIDKSVERRYRAYIFESEAENLRPKECED